MRSSKSPVDFFMKMKKKPPLQELYDNLENLTETEIENSGQPLWIREVLTSLQREGIPTEPDMDLIGAMADRMEAQGNPIVPTFPVFQWNHGDLWIKPQTSRLEIQLVKGDNVLCDVNERLIKIEYISVSVDHATIVRIMRDARYLGLMSDRQYIEYVSSNRM